MGLKEQPGASLGQPLPSWGCGDLCDTPALPSCHSGPGSRTLSWWHHQMVEPSMRLIHLAQNLPLPATAQCGLTITVKNKTK